MLFKISTLRSAIERYTGFYSKKGCVETATDVGKQLVDMHKAGKTFTVQDLHNIIAEKAPNIRKPNIATNKDEFLSLASGNRASMSMALATCDNPYIFGAFGPDIKGIFIKLDDIGQAKSIGVFSHELEHFMEYYANPQTILKRVQVGLKNIVKRINSLKKEPKLPLNTHRDLYLEQKMRQKPLKMLIHEDLMEKFGVLRAFKNFDGFAGGYEPTARGFEEFLKSSVYQGLDSTKRIDAYIRAILRHYVHPLTTKPEILRNLKTGFKREVTAYQVSDNITRYGAGKDGITHNKMRSEIYRRAARILEDEIKIAKHSKNYKKPTHRTGLPTSAVA